MLVFTYSNTDIKLLKTDQKYVFFELNILLQKKRLAIFFTNIKIANLS